MFHSSYFTGLIIALCMSLGFACSPSKKGESQEQQPQDQAAATAPKATSSQAAPKPNTTAQSAAVVKRGAPLPAGKPVTLDEITANPKRYAEKPALVSGRITKVCQAKGCWMTLAGKGETSRARITFKDYAFFVPKDAEGMRGVLSGVVQIKPMSEAERAHLAQDAKADISTIPQVEMRIVAEGVELHPQG